MPLRNAENSSMWHKVG